MRKGMERERKRRRLEVERREPNGVRLDPIFRKECGGEVIKKLNFIIRSERFFADCFSLTFGILPDGPEREWIGGRLGRRKILPGGNRPFSVRGIGGSQEKDGQRETFGGQREVKIFYSEQQGSWRIFGACGGRQVGEGFLAGKLKLRDETFRRQENRRVCSGRREELFQQLGPQEGQELFLPAGVKPGCGEKGKGSLQMERGGLREEIAGGYSSSWDRRRVRSFFSRRETWTWVMERRAAVFA